MSESVEPAEVLATASSLEETIGLAIEMASQEGETEAIHKALVERARDYVRGGLEVEDLRADAWDEGYAAGLRNAQAVLDEPTLSATPNPYRFARPESELAVGTVRQDAEGLVVFDGANWPYLEEAMERDEAGNWQWREPPQRSS